MSDQPDLFIKILDDDDEQIMLCVSDADITVTLTLEEAIGSTLPVYDGATTIIPSAEAEQVLPTQNHVLKDNITVKEIPYVEVTGISGGRVVSIG